MIANCPESVHNVDIRGQSPLHIAVKMGNENFVKTLLLDGNAQTGVKGHRLKTPLHYAKTPSIVKLLMGNLSHWDDPYHKMLLQLNEYDNKCNAIGRFVSLQNLYQCSCNENESKKKSAPSDGEKRSVLSSLLHHNDQAAIALLDEHIKLVGTSVDAKDALIVYDLKLFQQEANEHSVSGNFEKNTSSNEFGVHLQMLNTKSETFEHPLSTVFVKLQLRCFTMYLPWILLRTIMLVLSLSGLVLWQGHLLSTPSSSSSSNSSTKNSNKSAWHQINNYLNITGEENKERTWNFSGIGAILLFGTVCFSTMLILHRELTEVSRNFRGYFKDIKNGVEIALITSTITYLVGIFYMDVDSVKHAAAWSIFFAWIEILIILSRVPRIGLYTIIFLNVSKKLLAFFMLFMPGLLAFSFAFYSLPSVKDSAFHGVISSIIKIIIMMTGEIGFEDYFEWKKTKEHHSEGSTQILLLLFIVFVSIVLVNLLLGLAVSELEKERKVAKNLYNRIAVEEINSFWQNFNNGIYAKAVRQLWNCLKDRETNAHKPPTYLQKLSEYNGLFQSIRCQWLCTGLSDSDFSWKLCVDPNQRLNDENTGEVVRRGGSSRKDGQYEVYFFDTQQKSRFRSRNGNAGRKQDVIEYVKTDFALSEDMVSKTVNWLRQKQLSSSMESQVTAEKGDKFHPPIGQDSRHVPYHRMFSYHQTYQERYEELMRELNQKKLEFVNESKQEDNN